MTQTRKNRNPATGLHNLCHYTGETEAIENAFSAAIQHAECAADRLDGEESDDAANAAQDFKAVRGLAEAAPELLDALAETLTVLEGLFAAGVISYGEEIVKARAAIAKAQGE